MDVVRIVRGLPSESKRIIDELTSVLESVQTLAVTLTCTVDSAIEKIDSLHKTELSYISELKSVFFELSDVYDIADTYVIKVEDTFRYASNDVEVARIKRELDLGNVEPLVDFIHRLQRYLLAAGEVHVKFDETCRQASERSIRSTEACKAKQREARSKKLATRVIGGLVAAGTAGAGAAGGVAAGGTALAVASGPLTLGFGTVVGLGITAIVAPVAGIGAGVASAVITHFVAEDFKETEKTFKEIAENFDFLASSALTLNESIGSLHRRLEIFAGYIDEIEFCRQDREATRSVCKTMDMLYNRSISFYFVLSDDYEGVRVKGTELKRKIGDLYQ